jgi:hypothetical protein
VVKEVNETEGGEPIRRNLMVVSSIFLLYALAGGELKDTMSAGLVGVKIHREWVIIAAAWVWFGYAWLRYQLIYGGLGSQFQHLIHSDKFIVGEGDDNSVNFQLNYGFNFYRQSQHCNIHKGKLGLEQRDAEVFLYPVLKSGNGAVLSAQNDVITGRELHVNRLTLMGRWPLKFRSHPIGKTDDVSDVHALISWSDAPIWRSYVIWRLLISHKQFTGRYLPLAYAQFSLAVSILFIIPDAFKLLT